MTTTFAIEKTDNHRTVLIILNIILLSLVLPMTITSSSSQTMMFVTPQITSTTVGQTFSVNINISDIINLYGWEFKMGWNNTILDVVNITEGNFLKSSNDTFFWWVINNTKGLLQVDCTLLGNVQGVNGSGSLAIIQFMVKYSGESTLDLHDTKLVDSNEEPIIHQSADGFFSSARDVAVIEISFFPIIVTPGQFVQINVTVENQGSCTENFNVTVRYDSEIIEIRTSSLIPSEQEHLTFTWNTTGIAKGEYTISGEASIIQNETDTEDNYILASNHLIVLSVGHDVAIVNVTTSKTIIGQGYSLLVWVDVQNYGSFTETFNVTVYYNDTIILLPNGMNYTGITLTSGNSTKITTTWNTTDVSKGNYTLGSYATPVPDENDTGDNMYVNGWIIISIIGDLTGVDEWPDGIVDMRDVATVAKLFGVYSKDPRYNANCDITGHIKGLQDGIIDMRDVTIPARHFGEIDP